MHRLQSFAKKNIHNSSRQELVLRLSQMLLNPTAGRFSRPITSIKRNDQVDENRLLCHLPGVLQPKPRETSWNRESPQRELRRKEREWMERTSYLNFAGSSGSGRAFFLLPLVPSPLVRIESAFLGSLLHGERGRYSGGRICLIAWTNKPYFGLARAGSPFGPELMIILLGLPAHNGPIWKCLH